MSGPSSRASNGASDLALSRSRMLISELSRPEPLVPGVPPAFHVGWHYCTLPAPGPIQNACGECPVCLTKLCRGQERSVHQAQPSSRVR